MSFAASIGLAALAYLPFGVVQWPTEPPSREAWLAVLGLAIVCTGVAFLVFFALVAEVGPARTNVITDINPAVAIVLGVLILNETVTVTIALGFVLILAGSVVATGRNRRTHRTHRTSDTGGTDPDSGALTEL